MKESMKFIHITDTHILPVGIHLPGLSQKKFNLADKIHNLTWMSAEALIRDYWVRDVVGQLCAGDQPCQPRNRR